MWLFSKHGFFSAVRHSDKPDTIHLRARFRGDLERLFAAYDIDVPVCETPENDYRFRADLPRDVWARIVESEAEGIDYTNFKNAVHDGTERDTAYMRVWAAMRGAQEVQGD